MFSRQVIAEIETRRLRLRQWREEDFEPYARICADPEVMRYLPSVLTREQSERQLLSFVRHWEERGFGLWAVEEKAGDEFIGFIGLAQHDDWPIDEHKVEVGWRLDQHFWGRGLATEGAIASLHYGFDHLRLPRIISITDPRNAASRRVMEKVGLLYQGEVRWRGYEDVWYAADRVEWQARYRTTSG